MATGFTTRQNGRLQHLREFPSDPSVSLIVSIPLSALKLRKVEEFHKKIRASRGGQEK